MRILVLGGAGYVGSHFCRLADSAGIAVRVFDNFSTGHHWAVDSFEVEQGDILDTPRLAQAMVDVDAVCHFAAKIVVSESVKHPMLYESNNVGGTYSVLEAMSQHGVRALVFSSTAAVYGSPDPNMAIIHERCPCQPINPYGASKARAEQLIADWARSGKGSAIAFRYFNAAGALPQHGLGEAHNPETHLIPNILRALIFQKPNPFELYGDDYPTPDGTCIRDYIHVADIANAHLLGVEHLLMSESTNLEICNLGTGVGYSNLEVIKACEVLHSTDLQYKVESRRLGDPARLVASNERAQQLLGWAPNLSDLNTIVGSAYQWHLKYDSL